MKKIQLLLVLALFLVACEKDITQTEGPKTTFVPAAINEESFVSPPGVNDPRLDGFVMDLSGDALNAPIDIVSRFNCTGFLYGHTASIYGLGQGEMQIDSADGKTGVIKFGNLPYVHPTQVGMSFSSQTLKNQICALFSRESFNFEILPDGSLQLSAIAPGKPWDGSITIFSRQ